MANKEQVLSLFRKNPRWNSVMIAEAIGCESAYVRATLKRNGLSLQTRRISPLMRERERCASVAKAMGRPDIANEIMKDEANG